MNGKITYKPGSNALANSENRQVKNIIDKLDTLEAVNQFFKKWIDPMLVAHCRVANIRDGCLYIETDSPTFATPLQYQLPDILKKMRQEPAFANLRKIECYVKELASVGKKRNTTPLLNISQKNAEALSCVAEQITTPELKKILKQIAKHADKA